MPLAPGTTLGPYAVTAKIGEGGMGEVYRAASVLTSAAIALGIISGTWTIALAQGPAATEPLKLSEHVTVVLEGQPGAQSNVGIVVGDKATLVIDSGLGPRNGAILANVARQLSPGRTTLYVAATHFHPPNT